jgi:hypothetical protein
VDKADDVKIEIVQWPQQGWRPIDDGTGNEAGWVEGTFYGEWRGDVLYGRNDAVGGHYVLGWSTDPQRHQCNRRPLHATRSSCGI